VRRALWRARAIRTVDIPGAEDRAFRSPLVDPMPDLLGSYQGNRSSSRARSRQRVNFGAPSIAPRSSAAWACEAKRCGRPTSSSKGSSSPR